MKRLIRKWGNSLGIRIPNHIVKDLSLQEGTMVKIEEKDNKIIISPENPKLDELIKKINKTNLHSEISSGSNVGKEIW